LQEFGSRSVHLKTAVFCIRSGAAGGAKNGGEKMANEKLLSIISTIERALGMIEGVSYGLTDGQASALIDAVEMIDGAVKEIQDGK
jgi:hypothetical protein